MLPPVRLQDLAVRYGTMKKDDRPTPKPLLDALRALAELQVIVEVHRHHPLSDPHPAAAAAIRVIRGPSSHHHNNSSNKHRRSRIAIEEEEEEIDPTSIVRQKNHFHHHHHHVRP